MKITYPAETPTFTLSCKAAVTDRQPGVVTVP